MLVLKIRKKNSKTFVFNSCIEPQTCDFVARKCILKLFDGVTYRLS